MKKLLLTTLLLCAGLAATAYEYQFNWAQMEQNAYTNERSVTTNPTSGIDVYIHTNDDKAPNLYAWVDGGEELLGSWPGTRMTQHVAVAPMSNLEHKKNYYKIHLNANNAKIQVNNNGDADKSSHSILSGPGSYFFDYDGSLGAALEPSYSYTDGANSNVSNLYVKVIGDDRKPKVYAEFFYWKMGWPGEDTQEITLNGEKWYKYTRQGLSAQDLVNSLLIFNINGDNTTQTSDIRPYPSGDCYFYYYPKGGDDRYETVAMMGSRTNNFKEWDYTPYMSINGKEVTFTSANENRVSTLTIACQSFDDLNKIEIDENGRLSFPTNATIKITANDGYYLNKVWFGNSGQEYHFVGQTALTKDYIEDMGEGELWSGSHLDHLFKMTNVYNANFQTLESEQGWAPRFYLSPLVRVYTEGISLEDLVNAHHSVKRLNQAINHDLVGVGVRTINGTQMLIARSVDYVDNINPIKEGQELLCDVTGKPYEWSNPETKQYAWIALELPSGIDPADYVGKQLRGIRGMYCYTVADEGHLSWYNPCLQVDEFDQVEVVAEGVETHLITYSVACMTDQSYVHDYTGDRDTDQGSPTYQVQANYYMLKPHLCEICNVVDIMRTDDEVIWIPDTRGIMPISTEGNIEQIKPNIYVHNNIVGYANIERSYVDRIWQQADIDANCVGEPWRMRNKIYDIPEALLVASDFHKNDYPLAVPDRSYDNQLAKGGAIGLHIMGIARLERYDKDILVSNSDYWSRYNYTKDKNAYRNDLQIAPNTLSTKFSTMGDLIVERCFNGDRDKVQIATIKLDNSSGNQVQYTVTYTNEAELQDARSDEGLSTISTQPDFQKKTFNIGDLQDADHYINVYDMFYSQPMTSMDENQALYPEFVYHVRPANQGEGGSNVTTDVAGYAPVYKTDINVAGHSMYTKSQVDGDIDDKLEDDGKVKVYFTPNHATAVTRYDVLGGKVNDEEVGCPAKKSSTDLVNVDANNFMDYGIEIANAEQYKEFVPEAYTFYNDNTYGCYKEKVGNATVEMKHSELYESTEPEGETYEQHIYFCNLDLSTVLTLVENDERYLLRVWRQVGGESKVLLNGLEEFTHEYFDKGLAIEDFTTDTEKLYTHYGDLNTWAQKTDDGLLTVPDMFKHTPIGDKTVTYIVKLYVQDNKVLNAAQGVAPAGAPRRAQDNPQAYYVKRVEQSVTVSGVITGVDGIHSDVAVSSVRYVNVAGQVSDKPWSGVNMVVTTLADGTTRTSKIVR